MYKKKLLTILLLIFITCMEKNVFCDTQQKAITDTGEEVVLYKNGTWIFSKNNRKKKSPIPVNNKKFKKPKDSLFLVKSLRNNAAYWINADKWSFGKATNNPDAEYAFTLKGKSLYALSISEEMEVSLPVLGKLAFDAVKAKSPDAKLVRQEYRFVNGRKVLFMETKSTYLGIKVSFYRYCYSDASGSTQFVVYTSSNLVDKYKTDIDDLLNGLVTREGNSL